jgi:hypothetical protein
MGEENAAELSEAEARLALERFVVENDDLLALEERIGRFNIFDALGVARTEIKHSNFFAWLLDPAESHGQGSLFLRAILMDVLKRAPASQRPLSPIDLDGEDLRGVEIQREWRNIDILIRCEEPPFVIAIENKVDSGESKGQLQRYEDVVKAHWPQQRAMFVFLTKDGTEPTDEDWVAYSYNDVRRVLSRARDANRETIGDDVLAFLDHYLRLVETRLMEDQEIVKLCQRIYRNHRQAIDLINQHSGGPSSELLEAADGALRASPDKWHVFNRTSRRLEFVPAEWFSQFPPLGAKYGIDKRLWLVLVFDAQEHRARLHVELWNLEHSDLRMRIAQRLTADSSEFGFKVTFLKPTTRWNRLNAVKVAEWSEDSPMPPEQVIAALRKRLDDRQALFAAIAESLRPIFDEWKKSRQ